MARPNTGLSDEEIMRRVQAGDLRAFDELYDRFSSRAFGLARFICSNLEWAEEATQEGFVSVWRSRAGYDPARGSARVWLLLVVRHRCLDVVRRHERVEGRRTSAEPLDLLHAPGSIADDAELRDEALQVRTVLRELPQLQREVITLAYFGGFTHAEIAARLGLPMGTIKGRMRLGLQRIRAELSTGSTAGSSI